ncbi:MAG TPA: SEC-C metal-binding domain-containing protein [Pirellulales bacterium]|nr:SEC-C metal-binding domain-containing protein [Pirellulales bacterium]
MSSGDVTTAQPRFQRGDVVRVKSGVRHYNYPDLPIGGWTGEIVEIDLDGDGHDFRVDWSIVTLGNMHRVYVERCERDDMDESTMWLAGDELEADDGAPATIEQPNFPAWAMHAGDEQLAAIFGLGDDDPIPDTDIESLSKYHRFLAEHLTLPFEAMWEPEDDPADDPVKVLDLLPPTDETADAGLGLMCTIDVDDDVAEAVPLVSLYVSDDHPHAELLADYRHWIDGGVDDDDDWDDEDYDEDDAEYEEDYDGDEDDEYGPNSIAERMFEATMEGLRAGRDVLGDLPNRDELQRVQALADELILSELDPDPETDPNADADEAPQPLRKSGPAVGRNDPCPCGSGKKYKKCCMKQRD